MDHTQYRQGPGRRNDRGRAALFRHGAGQGRADHSVIATSCSSRCASAWNCSCRSARRSSMLIRTASFIATSSRRTCLVCMQDGKAVPKIIDFGVAKALAPKTHRRVDVYRDRPVDRHTRIHVARAGRTECPRHRLPCRRLRPRRSALRAPDRHDAPRQVAPPLRGLRRASAHDQRRRAPQAQHPLDPELRLASRLWPLSAAATPRN